MSYDLHVWSVERPSVPDALPRTAGWHPNGDLWSAGARSWQVVVGPVGELDSEDVPGHLQPALPGIRYLIELNLEPLAAPPAGYALLRRAARAIARQAHGVIVDPQSETVELPKGIKRYTPARAARVDVVMLSCWFRRELVDHDHFDGLVALIERRLPEALPRRYGLFEPAPHRYAQTGREHFVTFLSDHARDFVVWYPRRPVVYVNLGLHRTVGPTRHGFRSHCMSIEVDRVVLEQPGWQRALRDFWIALAASLDSFYGDVRTLRGGETMAGAYFPGGGHPIPNGWWPGIPKGSAHAVLLGEPYLTCGPRLPSRPSGSGRSDG